MPVIVNVIHVDLTCSSLFIIESDIKLILTHKSHSAFFTLSFSIVQECVKLREPLSFEGVSLDNVTPFFI